MGGTDLFNPAALFITFRETVEAVIILTVLFGFLDKAHQPHLKPAGARRPGGSVRWGVASGILGALSVGSAFIVMFYEAKTNLFEGDNEKVFEGSVMLVATFFISSLAFSMLRMFQLQIKWEQRLAEAAETAATTGKGGDVETEEDSKSPIDPRWTFFLLAFTSVFREGVETFVFMAGVAQAEPKSLPIPGIVGVIIGLIVGVFLFRGAKPANLAIFFYISTFMLFLIAGGLFSRGMHEFQEMGKFGKYWSDDAAAQGGGGRRHLLAVTGGSAASGLALPYPAPAHHHRALMGGDPAPAADTGEESVLETVEGAMTSDFFQADAVPVPVSWANTPLADWRECCDDGEHEFYILLRAIFGYSSVPTRLEVVTYCSYWLLMLSVLMFKLKKGTLYGKLLKGHEEKAVEEGSDATGGSGSSSEQPASSEEGAKDVALTFPEEASGSAVAPSGALAAEPQHPQGNVASAVTRTLAGIGRHAACARGWFARQESQRAVVEGAVWLSLFGLVVGLLCASLLPGIDLSVTEWEEGLPGSAPFPSLGVTRKFTLVIQEVEVALPGGGVRRLVTANGTFPGPELRAQHGNWVEVRIINNMSTHNTSMHWHGIVHRSSQFADGVVGITQCAIPARGEAETSEVIYRFECYHSGTFWYHGHFEGQYVDGLIGPLIVEGIPETHGRLYNAEWTWMAADWHNGQAHDIVKNVFLSLGNPDGFEPMPDAIVVNGKFSGDLRYAARRGDKVRVRFINSAAWSPWNVSVDGLPLTIIELDGQCVEPLPAPWIIVNVAQRVSFVIDFSKISGAALRASPQLFFRVEAIADTYPLGLEGMYANQGYKKLDPLFLGVIDFSTEAALGSAPRSAGGAAAATRPTYRLEDVPAQPFDALPPDQMTAQNTPAAEIDKATHRLNIMLTMENVNGINLGHLNGKTANPRPESPALMFRMVKFDDKYKGRPVVNDVWKDDDSNDVAALDAWDIVPDANGRYVVPYMAVVQMTIFNSDGGPHPFHLHGHKLALIASSDLPENEFQNGPNYLQRDVVTLPAAPSETELGWVKVQFVADNPGVWALHCHIDWHMSAGLLTEIIEAPDKLMAMTGDDVPKGHLKLCNITEAKGQQ